MRRVFLTLGTVGVLSLQMQAAALAGKQARAGAEGDVAPAARNNSADLEQWWQRATNEQLEQQAAGLVLLPGNNKAEDNVALNMISNAKKGSDFSQFSVGSRLLEGNLLQKNPLQAEFWLKQSALQGNEQAGLLLAGLYYNGAGEFKRDYLRCQRVLQQFANSQYPDFKLLLGVSYCYGKGCKPDAELGFKYLQQAADGGNLPALHFLALCYRDALGCERDYDRACEMLLQCAKQNYLASMTQYALMLEQGLGIEPDPEQAQLLLRQASARGCAQAAWHLAKQLRPQKGVPQPESPYMQALQQAAANGSVEAMQQLSLLYADKRFKAADSKRARYWKKQHASAVASL